MSLPRRTRFLAGLGLALLLGTGAAAAKTSSPPLSEAAGWLRGYLRIDTSNPPGRERAGAEYLARILHREGIATQLFVSAEGRASLFARLPADRPGEGGALLLLHHIDVVPPGPDWTRPPFAGTVENGTLWGRGAVDAKSLGIAELAAFIALKRSGAPRRRDVLFLAVADEENGGALGTAWLLEHHPELFRNVEAVVNEGGSNRVVNGRLLWWGIEVSQKRPLWLTVEADGRGGHASGLNPHSATHELIAGLDRLLELPPRWRVSPPVKRYLEALAPLHNPHWRDIFLHLDDIISASGPSRGLMPGMASFFIDTVQVTVVRAGSRINVIPAEATAKIDIRMLPDTDGKALLEQVREALGREVAVRVLLTAPPAPASPTDSRLYRAAASVLGGEGPVVPAFIAGFTDSRYFRQRGIPAYGISPFTLELRELRGIHGADEQIRLKVFDRGVERLRRMVTVYATDR